MDRKISMEEVSVSPATLVAWEEACKSAAFTVRAVGVKIRPEEIAKEEFFIRDEKKLVIKATIGPLKIELLVPEGHWTRPFNN